MAELADRLFLWPCPAQDITLFSGTAEDRFTVTPTFHRLRQMVGDLRPDLLLLDSATQIAAIPENNRALVTRSLQGLTKLSAEFDLATVLNGHNNRDGDYSGSSAWENRSRSRLHMKRERKDNGEEIIKLARPKSNYAVRDDEGLTIEWRLGCFCCLEPELETPADRLDRKVREGTANQAFLDALDKLAEQGRHTSAASTASNYAPRLMEEAGMAAGFTKRELEQAMQRLFAENRIVAKHSFGKRGNRHAVFVIARTGTPL